MDQLSHLHPGLMKTLLLGGIIGGCVYLWLHSANGQKKKIGGTAYLKDHPGEFKAMRIHGRRNVSHDTIELQIEIPHGYTHLGLPSGKHIAIKATIGGKVITRSYTPISTDEEEMAQKSDDDAHYFTMVIKVYDGEHCMSKYLKEGVQVGDSVEVKGPTGLFEYIGNGQLKKKASVAVPTETSHLFLIAGGSGITPMIQLLKHVIYENRNSNNENNRKLKKITLLYSNHTIEDILMKEYLDSVHDASKRGEVNVEFDLWYTVTRESKQKLTNAKWKMGTSRIDQAVLTEKVPSEKNSAVVLLCGPSGLTNQTCKPILVDQLGYDADHVITL